MLLSALINLATSEWAKPTYSLLGGLGACFLEKFRLSESDSEAISVLFFRISLSESYGHLTHPSTAHLVTFPYANVWSLLINAYTVQVWTTTVCFHIADKSENSVCIMDDACSYRFTISGTLRLLLYSFFYS